MAIFFSISLSPGKRSLSEERKRAAQFCLDVVLCARVINNAAGIVRSGAVRMESDAFSMGLVSYNI